MARLFTTGLELGKAVTDFNYYNDEAFIQSTTKRSGSYAVKFTANSVKHRLGGAFYTTLATSTTYFARAHVMIETAPNVASILFGIFNTTLDGDSHYDILNGIYVKINTDRTLTFFDGTGTATQIGSASSALTLNTWYQIEVAYNRTTLAISARLSGMQFASGTASADKSLITIWLYQEAACSSGVWYFDDIGVNDSTGSYQNSFPGKCTGIIALRPNAVGSTDTWTPSTGSNYACVDEVPPNSTDYVYAKVASLSDLYNCEDFTAPDFFNINVIHVDCFLAGQSLTQANNAKFRVQMKVGTTTVRSGEIQPAGTNYYTAKPYYASQIGYGYPLTLYNDPDGNVWTDSALDSMQIGVYLSTTASYYARISAVWAMVEYLETTPRELTANISGASSTSAVAVYSLILLLASISGASSSPNNIHFNAARKFAASITNGTVTSEVLLATLRGFVSSISGSTNTSEIEITLQGFVSLLASITGESASSDDIAFTLLRALLVSIEGESITTVEAFITLLRRLVASVTGVSSTHASTFAVEMPLVILNPDVKGVTKEKEFTSTTALKKIVSINLD